MGSPLVAGRPRLPVLSGVGAALEEMMVRPCGVSCLGTRMHFSWKQEKGGAK